MEVRTGQHASTIAQACAHNTRTIISDLEMFSRLLTVGGSDAREQARVANVKTRLENAYETLLDLYTDFVAVDLEKHDVLDESDAILDVKAFIRERIAHDMQHAHVYETR